MNQFWSSLIQPLLEALMPARIVETGCGSGELTRRLLAYCEGSNAILEGIEPDPTCRVGGWRHGELPRLRFHAKTSVEAWPTIGAVDLALLDGDANYATVSSDLRSLDDAARRQGKPFPVVIVARVGWPTERRDRYAAPERLGHLDPDAFAKGGLWPRHPGVRSEGGYAPGQYYSIAEGGESNGVRTAVEDWLEKRPDLGVIWIPGHEGVAIVYPLDLAATHASFGAWLSGWTFAPCVANLLETLEAERVRLSTQLIDSTVHFHRLDRARQGQMSGLEQRIEMQQHSLGAIETVVDKMKGLLVAVKTSTQPAPSRQEPLSARIPTPAAPTVAPAALVEAPLRCS